jgi:rhodanese-related sulfurtransferase
MQLGYKNVQSLQGGWNAWNETYPDIKKWFFAFQAFLLF